MNEWRPLYKVTEAIMKPFLASVNPFDLKAALLAGHAQHPVIIHFRLRSLLRALSSKYLRFGASNRFSHRSPIIILSGQR